MAADFPRNVTICSWRSKKPIAPSWDNPIRDVIAMKYTRSPVKRVDDHDAFFMRIMVPSAIVIGENIQRYHSGEKSFPPAIAKYWPIIDVSLVERNMRTPRTIRIPHARIFWSSTVMKLWCCVFFLAMGIVYRKWYSMQKEKISILYHKNVKCIDLNNKQITLYYK